jgi:predicted enzyme related to lactoylglutathione lyase
VGFGLETCKPIEDVVQQLGRRGVRFVGDIIRYEAGNCVGFDDPDGTSSYLQEWASGMTPEAGRESGHDAEEEGGATLSGGHALVYVSDMDNAVRFYTEVFGLRLTFRYEDKIAFVEVGSDLVIGLHPRSPMSPSPGTRGSVTLGLRVDEPIRLVLSRLVERGVRLAGDVLPSELGSTVEIEDPDGNPIYLWEPGARRKPENDLASQSVTPN